VSIATEPVRETVRAKIAALRAEFVELAFDLECRGRLDAADVAMAAAARIEEVADELGPENRTAEDGPKA
jgi:hypothetical protein